MDETKDRQEAQRLFEQYQSKGLTRVHNLGRIAEIERRLGRDAFYRRVQKAV